MAQLDLKVFGLLVFSALSLCLIAVPGHARTAEDVVALLPQYVLRNLHKNPDHFKQQTMRTLFKLDASGVATPERVKTAARVQHAIQRAKQLHRFFMHDLDGDGTVEELEREIALSANTAAQKADARVFYTDADADKDGKVTYQEAARQADAKLEKTTLRSVNNWDVMVFDLNEDGRVDVAELSKAIDEIVQLTEQDPTILASPPRQTKATACKLPAPSKTAKIVVLGGSRGPALSTVAVSGLDMETTVTSVTIEPGTHPLWILAPTFDSLVWKVSGRTERIEHFIIQPPVARPAPGVGVVGVAKDKIAYVPAGACVDRISSADGGKAQLEKAKLAAILSRPVDHFITNAGRVEIAVPSGNIIGAGPHVPSDIVIVESGKRFAISRDGVQELDDRSVADAGLPGAIRYTQRELHRFYPGGIIEIDLKAVVASSPVARYDVLPQQAGLLQLLRDGSLTRTSDGFYRIKKPIARFPAGLNGAFSAKFILGKSVPMPAGNPGHSTIYSEETGKCLRGPRCPR